MAAQVLEVTKKLSFRILSKDKVYYVLYDVDAKTHMSYHDERYMCPAGLWHWQEREVVEAVREYLEKEAVCETSAK